MAFLGLAKREVTFVVRQQVEERLADLLPSQRLNVLQAVQQGPDGVILSLSVNRTHSVPVRKLAFSHEVQDVPSLVEITVSRQHRLTATHLQRFSIYQIHKCTTNWFSLFV